MPRAHHVHLPHAGRNEKTTWSPSLKPGVFGPTALTMPEPSWPPAKGYMPTGMSPVAMWSSEWQSPEATIWTCSSPCRGSSTSRSTTS